MNCFRLRSTGVPLAALASSGRDLFSLYPIVGCPTGCATYCATVGAVNPVLAARPVNCAWAWATTDVGFTGAGAGDEVGFTGAATADAGFAGAGAGDEVEFPGVFSRRVEIAHSDAWAGVGAGFMRA